MTCNNTAALTRFGELYKAAWTKLSERFDDVPHYDEIAASFDRITATQQGRDLVYLFAETRTATFRTAGDDLVARRNRAAFMIALAQYKRELAASAAAKPADVAATATQTQSQQPAGTKPARKRSTLYPVLGVGATSRIEDDNGKVYLCFTNGALCMDVLIDGFFPLAQNDEKKILPHIAGALTAETAGELYKILCGMIKGMDDAHKKRLAHNLATLADLLDCRPGLESIAAQYRTAGNKTEQDADQGVKVSGKTESFYTFQNKGCDVFRHVEAMGYRAAKGAFTFHIYKFNGYWHVVENSTGLSIGGGSTKSKAINHLKAFDLNQLDAETMRKARQQAASMLARCKAAA